MDRKYIIYPGWVKSKTDGDNHYLDAPTLANLYGVPLDECLIAGKSGYIEGLLPDRLIPLYPRRDGNYQLQGEQ